MINKITKIEQFILITLFAFILLIMPGISEEIESREIKSDDHIAIGKANFGGLEGTAKMSPTELVELDALVKRAGEIIIEDVMLLLPKETAISYINAETTEEEFPPITPEERALYVPEGEILLGNINKEFYQVLFKDKHVKFNELLLDKEKPAHIGTTLGTMQFFGKSLYYFLRTRLNPEALAYPFQNENLRVNYYDAGWEIEIANGYLAPSFGCVHANKNKRCLFIEGSGWINFITKEIGLEPEAAITIPTFSKVNKLKNLERRDLSIEMDPTVQVYELALYKSNSLLKIRPKKILEKYPTQEEILLPLEFNYNDCVDISTSQDLDFDLEQNIIYGKGYIIFEKGETPLIIMVEGDKEFEIQLNCSYNEAAKEKLTMLTSLLQELDEKWNNGIVVPESEDIAKLNSIYTLDEKISIEPSPDIKITIEGEEKVEMLAGKKVENRLANVFKRVEGFVYPSPK